MKLCLVFPPWRGMTNSVLGKLKFFRKGKPTQVYGMSIPDVMINDDIKKSKGYQKYLAISFGIIAPKKKRKGIKATDTPKKRDLITTEENILFNPDEALKLRESISLTEAHIAEEEQQLHETHASLIIGREQTSKVDKEVVESQKKKKLKGIASNIAAKDLFNIKKENKKAEKIIFYIRFPKASSEGSGAKPEVPGEPKGKSTSSSEGAEEIILSSDDEKIESENKAAKSEKSDEETADDEDVHSDKEVHNEEEQQMDNEHYDEEVHDDVEKHDDADEEMKCDHSTTTEESVQANVINEVKNQLSKLLPKVVSDFVIQRIKSMVCDVLQKDPINLQQKDVSEIHKIKLEHATKEKVPKYSTTLFDQAAMDEYNQKDILFKIMRESKSYDKHPKHKALYDALVQSLLVDEDDIDRGVAKPHTQKRRHHEDEGQDHPLDSAKEQKRQRKNDVEPPMKSSMSKESSKTSKIGKSVTAKELAKEPIHEIVIDVEEPILDDAVSDADQPQEVVDPKKDNSTWFKKPPRPETPDPEGNQDKKYLVGPVYKLLSRTCKSNIELEYNMDQCYNALTDQLDWTNPKGDGCPYDLSKPLPLQGSPVYSTMKTLSVIKVKVDKRLGYGYLEENVVRKADRQEYSCKEGDFPRLRLNDIEDMLLLHVQNKLFNLPGDDIVDLQGDDPIDAINHMMSFLLAVITSRYPTTNNQLRNSLNPRQQATINDGRVTLQPVQGRQISFATEELAFLAVPGIAEGQATQIVITHNVAYQADDLDAYDSDCVKLNIAKVSLIVNLSYYSSNVLVEVHNPNNINNNRIIQSVQAMPSSEHSSVVNRLETKITSDRNIIPYP
nr:hypothetical protein [Tanacetum cinerariifolium]